MSSEVAQPTIVAQSCDNNPTNGTIKDRKLLGFRGKGKIQKKKNLNRACKHVNKEPSSKITRRFKKTVKTNVTKEDTNASAPDLRSLNMRSNFSYTEDLPNGITLVVTVDCNEFKIKLYHSVSDVELQHNQLTLTEKIVVRDNLLKSYTAVSRRAQYTRDLFNSVGLI